MGLYERILKEVSRKEPSDKGEVASGYGRHWWSLPAPGAGGYVTVVDLQWAEERLQREQVTVLQDQKRRASEVSVLQGFARRGVHTWVEGIAFKSLQRKYPAEWDTIRWK